MQPLRNYKLCIICDTKYITHIKYKNCDKICPRCRKRNPVTVIDQRGNKNARMEKPLQ